MALIRKKPLVLVGSLVVLIAIASGAFLLATRKQAQTITIQPPPSVTFGDPPLTLRAEASSGLPVEFSIKGGPCEVRGALVAANGAGVCEVRFVQPGDATYGKAERVVNVSIAKASQSIDFSPPASIPYPSSAVSLNAKASSGLPVSFSASGACNIHEGTLVAAVPGACVVIASQSGDSNYFSAGSLSRTIFVVEVKVETTQVVNYFQVSGLNTDAIFASFEANGPTLSDGSRGLGVFRPSGRPEIKDTQRDGKCAIETLTLRLTYTITLPQHAERDQLSLDLRQKWDALAASVADHEQEHANVFTRGLGEMRDALLNIPSQDSCLLLRLEIDRVWEEHLARIEIAQDEFHAADDARRKQQAAPLRAQLDSTSTQLDALEAQIATLTLQIDSLDAELSGIDNRLTAIENELNSIDRQYPGAAPSAVATRYNNLVEEYNGLLPRARQITADLSRLAAQHDTIVGQYNSLLGPFRTLVDEYTWRVNS